MLLPLRLLASVWVAALLCLPSLAGAQAPSRIALLIGNSAYAQGRLRNPPNDVKVMDETLRGLGFKTQVVLDANQNQMKRAVRDFGAAAQGVDVAFLYYSGHGTQAAGENFLIPLQATIEKESDYEVEALSANAVLRQIAGARPKAAIVVLDACRDNPVAALTRGGTKGLSRMEAPTGTLIAFATAPNTTASDEGHYARVLAQQLRQPGVELLDAFRNTTSEVLRLSRGKQEPRVSEVSITERIYLAGRSTSLAPRPGLDLSDLQREADHDPQATQLRLMQADFDKVSAFTGPATLQVQAWERFLAGWRDAAPASATARELLHRAEQQLAAARQPPATTPAPARPGTPPAPALRGPVTLVVPFAPGGPVDVAARSIAPPLARALGMPVVIENQPGAGSAIGSLRVAKAAGDGNTLLMQNLNLMTRPLMSRSADFATTRDFAPLGLVMENPLLIVGRADLPANSWAELARWLRGQKARFASAGIGSVGHLCAAQLEQALGVEVVHVPYRGTAPALTDVSAGQADLMCETPTALMGQVKAGRIKAFLVTASTRLPDLPAVTTADEAGLRALRISNAYGLYGPAKLPAELIAHLHAALRSAMLDASVVKATQDLSALPVAERDGSPAEHGRWLALENARWATVIQRAGIQTD